LVAQAKKAQAFICLSFFRYLNLSRILTGSNFSVKRSARHKTPTSPSNASKKIRWKINCS